MCQITKANGICDLCHIDFLLLQKSHCLLQTDVSDELTDGQTCHFFHLSVELRTTDTHLPS